MKLLSFAREHFRRVPVTLAILVGIFAGAAYITGTLAGGATALIIVIAWGLAGVLVT